MNLLNLAENAPSLSLSLQPSAIRERSFPRFAAEYSTEPRTAADEKNVLYETGFKTILYKVEIWNIQ